MRARKPKEKTVEKGINRYAKARGVLTYKFTSPARRGVTDRVFVAPAATRSAAFGAVGFLEVKRPGKKPTPLQQHEMDKLEAQGAIVMWVDTVEKGKAFIDGLLLL